VEVVETVGDLVGLSYSYVRSWNRQDYQFSLRQNHYDYYDYSPEQGESGGGIFIDGKLVGVVSGGWFWRDDEPRKTWPLRSGRIDAILEGLK